MKEKYLIAIDLDDTIISNYKDYDLESFEVIRAISKHHKIVLATGRPFRSTIETYKMLELDTPLICYSGAYSFNPLDYSFPTTNITFSKNDVISFSFKFDENIVNMFCEIKDNIYLLRDMKEIYPFLHVENAPVYIGPFSTTIRNNINSALLFVDKKASIETEEYFTSTKISLRNWYEDDKIHVYELYNKKASKGKALKKIQKYYNINKVIAIGDNINDIDMFKHANIKVAMGNADIRLKKLADIIIPSISESGVGKYLRSLK